MPICGDIAAEITCTPADAADCASPDFIAEHNAAGYYTK